jgi:DNA helicase II / ATP-dependent DNA helicase PcrA
MSGDSLQIIDPWADETPQVVHVEDLLEGLNPAQQSAVLKTEGPLLILAGAGSGKTKTLTHRIAYLLRNKLATEQSILSVTFTNKAAKEMRERVAALLGRNNPTRSFMPYMGTFHSICVRILREDGEHVGVDKRFVIFDENDRQSLVKNILKKLRVDEKKTAARSILSIISGAKNELIGPQEFAQNPQSPLERLASEVFPEYEKGLRQAAALDFDDLIGKVVLLLQSSPHIGDKWRKKFTHIMIDEYQDTNAAQYKLIQLLCGPERNLAVVGDDWQSIYSWRGADYTNILNFERDFPSAFVVKLEQNYRSTKNILDAAHGVISKNTQRSDKELWTEAGKGKPVELMQAPHERAEGDMLVRRISNSHGMKGRDYKDFAVLYRTNAQSRSLEDSFMRHGVPYRIYGGLRFYDRKEIKDLLAYLRLIYQPEDIASFLRIVNVPARSIGDKSLTGFLEWRATSGASLYDALLRADECTGITPKARDGLRALGHLLDDFRSREDIMTVPHMIDGLIKRLNYLNYLDDGTIQGESRQENVKELKSVAEAYAELGLAAFIEEVALVAEVDNGQDLSNTVTLMTMHAAKGLEFNVVFITGLEESVFPTSRALYDPEEMEEERRLCYVAMTRAREELYLAYSTARMLYGSMQYNAPSRFLGEVGGEVGETAASHVARFQPDDGWQPSYATTRTHEPARPPQKVQPVSTEPRYVIELQIGDGVFHDTFGTGSVLELDGDIALVYFQGKGAKKLNITLAPIKKLGGTF